MNLPQTVTHQDFALLAAENEAHAVRVLVRCPGNTGPYTIRGRFRRYVATHDEVVGCHILDVPLSVWMTGIPSGIYQDNLSVAHDLQASRTSNRTPLVVLVIPWVNLSRKESTDDT